MKPTLFTFDIFGTVLDWRTGLSRALGRALDDAEFDAIIDHQGRAEKTPPFRPYADLVADSLVQVLGLAPDRARAIGAAAGTWPLFPDSVAAMRRLLATAPCVATTNSDRVHGEQVQAQLGRLSHWFCAEDLRCYKPSRAFFEEVARRLGRGPDRSWWHVSAYGDYDLEVARALGMTAVFIRRPHHRVGPADVEATDLLDLCDRLPST